MKNAASAIATVLVAIVAIWLLFKLLGVALKLIGILIIGGIAFAAYFAVTQRLGGPDRRA